MRATGRRFLWDGSWRSAARWGAVMQFPRATSVRISVRRIVRTKDGRTVYVHQGDVYDSNGCKVGYVNPRDDSRCIGTV